MADFAELIARLEKATGPDGVCDALIAASDNRWTVLEIGEDKNSKFIRFARHDGSEFTARNYNDYYTNIKYTASIDAALTLVPLQHSYAMGDLAEDGHPWACVTDIDGRDFNSDGASCPIAVCIAALKARSIVAEEREVKP